MYSYILILLGVWVQSNTGDNIEWFLFLPTKGSQGEERSLQCSIYLSRYFKPGDGFGNRTWVLSGYPQLPLLDASKKGNGKAVTTPFLPTEFLIYEHHSSAILGASILGLFHHKVAVSTSLTLWIEWLNLFLKHCWKSGFISFSLFCLL